MDMVIVVIEFGWWFIWINEMDFVFLSDDNSVFIILFDVFWWDFGFGVMFV